jgi:transglutaminase-like putative cysteine protease
VSAAIEFFDYPRRMERLRLLWTLAAFAAMAAPHALHLPPWIMVAAVGLGLWRLAAAWRGWRLPGRYARYGLGIVIFVAVLFTFRTLNGPEAGAGLLLLLSMLKLMEAQGLRDYFLLVVLAYFLGLANFLYDQNIPLALYMLPAVWLTTASLLNATHPDVERGIKASLKNTGRLLLPALPVAAALFLLFPRVPGPLWGIATQKHSGVIGLSTTMTPGDLSQLAESDEVAFRVKFAGAAPPRKQLYWRALVLHDYDGSTWNSGNLPWNRKFAAATHGGIVSYDVTLEPNNLSTLYALDLPLQIPEDTALSSNYEIAARAPVTERKLYHAASYLDSSYGADTPGWMLHRDLVLPGDRNPRTRALAEQWRAAASSSEQVVNDALTMFHEQAFSYTLKPGLLTNSDRVDEFLFGTRRGFCEHYAGAFVILMRAAGIPAHVVIGYQGGEPNPLDDYYVVRQRDAHAWAEVWMPDRGWLRVDPTAAVDPARVEQGLDAALPSDEIPGLLFGDHPWLNGLRNTWDAVNNGWNQWVLAYGPELQEKLFKNVGLDYGNWGQLAIVLAALLILFAMLVSYYLWWQRRPPPPHPVVRDYRRFCVRLAKLGLKREAREGPLDFAERVTRVRPDLEPAVRAITTGYIELRYVEQGDAERFHRLVKTFKPSPAPR